MATFLNQTKTSAIASVEFSPQPEGNLTFFHLSDDTFSQVGHKPNKESIRDYLTGTLGQTIIGESEINGRPVLIARGAKTQQEIITALETRGDKLKLPEHKHEFRPWVWRGNLSMVGQILQLTSSLMTAKVTGSANKKFAQEALDATALRKSEIEAQALRKVGRSASAADLAKMTEKLTEKTAFSIKSNLISKSFDKNNFEKKDADMATFMFATSNIAANTTNIAFGAEKVSDPHQLRWLKENFNKKLAMYMPEGGLPSPDDKRAALRKEPAMNKSYDGKFRDFMQRNSVTIGEIGLRYFGAINLAFPLATAERWKQLITMKEKSPDKAQAALGVRVPIARKDIFGKPKLDASGQEIKRSRFEIAFNSDDKFTGYAGISYILGKAIAFMSKVPDPFDPKPHTWIDTFREQVAFRLSSLTEAVAAGTIAYDRFRSRRVVIPAKSWIPKNLHNTVHRDWFGCVGGVLFMGGLIIRIFAPFGAKVMNMEELNAHITDGLARVPREKLPQLMAETAASIKEHFKDKVPEMSQIYTQLATDLYRYHHIAMPEIPTGVEGAMLANNAAKEPEVATKMFASDNLKKTPAIAQPRSASHQEQLAAATPQTAGLGA